MLIKVDRALTGGVVKIDVGEPKTPFYVHLELLCACSPYFEALFEHRFDQPLAEPVTSLPEDDPQVFAQIVLWMYRGNDSLESLECKKLDFMVRLWMLAGRLEMADFQNHVMLICKAKTNSSPTRIMSYETVNYIYAHTLPQSPMRRLAVDIWVRRVATDRFENKKEELPRLFLEDLCHGFIRERESMDLPRTLSEDLYITRPSSPTDKRGIALPPRESIELRCAASEAQTESRKIKIPCSRTKGNSVVLDSAPASPEAGIDTKADLAEDLKEVNITSEAN